MKDVPYIVFESTTSRLERSNKRAWIIAIICIFLLMITNLGWLCYESQFERHVTTVKQDIDTGDGDGDTNVTGIGDIVNGENQTESNSEN